MNENRVIRRLDHAGKFVLRYGLALVLLWIGAMKFTEYEATGIQPLVENSFLLRWVYSLFSVQMFAALLGIFEIVIGLLIALRPIAPKPSAVGSALAAIMFLVTLSFLFTTPGWEPSLGGFPALSVVPGQFVLKDIVFLGAALWATTDALSE
jgi:uncharacterized membrane protein YkgB